MKFRLDCSSPNFGSSNFWRSNRISKVTADSANLAKLSAAIVFFSVLTACTASNKLESPATANTQKAQPQAADKHSGDKRVAGPTRTLNTVMTAEGVECPAVREADGTLYTIPSMPHSFEEGDKLNIIVANPIIPFASFCQQGETIEWIRIEQISASGEILKYWEK